MDKTWKRSDATGALVYKGYREIRYDISMLRIMTRPLLQS